jgi:chemotaxis protein methyltransferase WspC
MAAIEQAARTRQTACAIDNPGAYCDRARGSADELQALVETVVVPETWFFRDREAFDALAADALATWIRQPDGRPLRLMSLPCSTGEEPYSMAMALLSAGIPADRFEIDAIDVSRRALTRARLAHYGANSFRGSDQEFRARYFRASGAQFQIVDAVRAPVRFRQGNLFDERLCLVSGLYDVVFCRNLLIYFDRETQARAIRALTSWLAPNGRLFVAPSEAALLLDHGFVTVSGVAASGFTRPPAPSRETPAPPAASPRPGPFTRRRTDRVTAPTDTRSLSASAGARRESDLAAATDLANTGFFAEASRQCHAYLREHGPFAQAYFLLGLVHDTLGDASEAEAFYRKALYLDPYHVETLTHLSYLIENRGDAGRALALRQRLRRLDAAGGAS